MKYQILKSLTVVLTLTLLLLPSSESLAGVPASPAAPAGVSDSPLAPADTSSPRSTLLGFIEIVNSSHAQLEVIVKSYRKSSRLYFSDEELADLDRMHEKLGLAKRTLNFSELPKALAATEPLFRYRIFELKEVLDRLELPAAKSIPDAEMMAASEFKRWTIPGTEITIERVDQGSRAGEYLFSPETVERLPEFYNRIKHLPYLSDETAGWYERYRYGGAGLRAIIPLRWMASMPAWATATIMDQPIWRWLGIVIVFSMAWGLFALVRKAGLRWARRGQDHELRRLWSRLIQVVSLLVLIPAVIYVLTVNLRFSGLFLEIATLTLWALFTLTLTCTAWLVCSVSAESIVTSQQLLAGSIDSQLIRLALRLVATMLSVTILVVGAQQLGIPAYSVIAGLGVGGIAFALAAKDSLANLLGSLLIMFEKPFRIGHWIKVGDTEGIVESIGFRSTRIRTFHNSLVSIPSDTLVNTAVDNMTMREKQVVETVIHIPYSTSSGEVESFIAELGKMIGESPLVHQDDSLVKLDEYGEDGLHIFIQFSLPVSDYSSEKTMKHELLLDILKLADARNIKLDR
jgi:MscS family membrane protein